MHVFVTGASGHIASAVIPELLSAGHSVTGLARSAKAEAIVRALGADVRRGDLDELETLRAAAEEADGVIHLAFKHDEQNSGDLAAAVDADLRAIHALGDALAGSDRPLVATDATGALALAGFTGTLTEDDTLPGGPRIDAENAVVAFAEQGVRASVIRLPPTVHSGGRYGFVSGLIEITRATRIAGYLGEGTNRWPSAHASDVARLYRLALESAPAATRLRAVDEQGIPLREIADVIGARLDVPVAPVSSDDAHRHFGPLTPFISLDNPVSSRLTRETLPWTPAGPGLIAELEHDNELTAVT